MGSRTILKDVLMKLLMEWVMVGMSQEDGNFDGRLGNGCLVGNRQEVGLGRQEGLSGGFVGCSRAMDWAHAERI